MNLLSCLLVALGLSLDNCAVTVACGCGARSRVPGRYVVQISVLFALAHFVMFSLGWLLGEGVGRFLGSIGHWLAFGILLYVGAHMVKESFSQETSGTGLRVESSFKVQLWLAVATSLDAWLAGMSLAFMQGRYPATVCALTVSVLLTSSSGFYLGAWLGRTFGKRMEALGGVVLILLGGKWLLEGLGIW